MVPLVARAMTPSLAPLQLRDLGRAGYTETLALQHRLVHSRLAAAATEDLRTGDIDTLLLVEHPPVITLGRRRDAADHVLAPADTPVVRVERGGDVTWHGPGQLVGYPIVLLRPGERDVLRFLRNLERAFVDLARALGLDAFTRDGHTGVWARPAGADPASHTPKKIVSLGIAVRRWVTFHGFALNVDCDLAEFARIQPCGYEPSVMGSLASLSAAPLPPASELRAAVARHVAAALGRALVQAPPA